MKPRCPIFPTKRDFPPFPSAPTPFHGKCLPRLIDAFSLNCKYNAAYQNFMNFSVTSSLLAAGLVLSSTAALADVKLPAIFGDHMVLQQGATIPVWGHADAGEKITVTFGPSQGSATAGIDGKWRVDLPAVPGGNAGRHFSRGRKNHRNPKRCSSRRCPGFARASPTWRLVSLAHSIGRKRAPSLPTTRFAFST